MKSDMASSVAPKSSVDENSASSVSNGASSNSNSGATTGEDLSNGGGVAISNSNSGGGVANGAISLSLQSSPLIGSGVVGLTSLALETAGITLGVPQPAHQASNIILTRAVSSNLMQGKE